MCTQILKFQMTLQQNWLINHLFFKKHPLFRTKAARWNWRGAFLVMMGALLTTLSNSLVHGYVQHIPAAQLLFLKSFFGLALMMPLWWKRLPVIWQSTEKKWHGMRAFCGAVGNILWIFSLQKLSLPDATTLSLLSAVLTSIGAFVFFKEQLRRATLLAIMLSFGGVVIFLKPSFVSGDSLAIFLPIGSAICFSAASLIIKKVSLSDSLLVSLWYLLVFMGVLASPYAFYDWHPLTGGDLLYVTVIALIYVILQWSLIDAYTHATAGFLAPFKFARLPFGFMSGVFFFHETVHWHVLMGAFFIFLSCIFIQRDKDLASVQLKNR